MFPISFTCAAIVLLVSGNSFVQLYCDLSADIVMIVRIANCSRNLTSKLCKLNLVLSYIDLAGSG